MNKIAIALAAFVTLGLAVPAMATADAKMRGACLQSEAQPAATPADELSARRKWKRHGWRGHRHWRGHRWHGRRAWRGHRWHGRRYYRGPRWHVRRYWGGGRCFGNRGRCIGVWRYGRKVIVCCR